MKEVGGVLGIGESRVSQLHSLALVRLRARLQELMQSRGAARQGRRGHPQPLRTRRTTWTPLLNLAELGSLRGKARGKTSAVRSPGEAAAATAFDPRQMGQPSAAQLHGLEILHQSCAQKIAAALGRALRVSVEVEPARRGADLRRGVLGKTFRGRPTSRRGEGPRRTRAAATGSVPGAFPCWTASSEAPGRKPRKRATSPKSSRKSSRRWAAPWREPCAPPGSPP